MNEEAELLRSHAEGVRARDGLPAEDERRARVLALQEIQSALGGSICPDGLTSSPLGVEWTDRFEVQVDSWPSPDLLRRRGWLPLGRLLGDRSGVRCWAVRTDGQVLAAVRLALERADPVRTVLDRCEERGEVRLREVLELRALVRAGARFPLSSRVLQVAADVETGLGERELVRWTTGRRAASPAPLPPRRARRGFAAAVSGVDGSGKSSVGSALALDLTRASVPLTHVWLRPGMGLGQLVRLAALTKRLVGQGADPGVRAVAEDRAASLPSRRGAVGWIWALLVTAAFLAGVRRQRAAARGVVLHDRHLLDALATLDFAYEGVDLRAAKALTRWFLPPVDVTLYLRVPAEVAVARKPGDTLGAYAVARQLEAYDDHLQGEHDVMVLDGTAPRSALARQALDAVAEAACRPRLRRRWVGVPGRPPRHRA